MSFLPQYIESNFEVKRPLEDASVQLPVGFRHQHAGETGNAQGWRAEALQPHREGQELTARLAREKTDYWSDAHLNTVNRSTVFLATCSASLQESNG